MAVKFLNPSDVGTQEINRLKFESEIQIMRLCRHANIISCLGAYITQARAHASALDAFKVQPHGLLSDDTATLWVP